MKYFSLLFEPTLSLAKELTKLYNHCLKHQKVPNAWKNSELILVHKKRDIKDIRNYQPLSLLTHVYKIFTKVLTKRLERKIDGELTREQAGFRKNCSTMDHTHIINKIREKYRSYNLPLCLVFMDFKKAFDSVEISAILTSLKTLGVDHHYIHLLKDIYSNCSSTIILNNNKINFNINKGIRQGDTISPKLFTACLEYIFKNFKWDQYGLNIDGEILNHLKFADGILLITTNLEEAERMLIDLNRESKNCGLKINKMKTKVMISSRVGSRGVKLERECIEEVNNYIYLGQNISLQETNQGEIKRRIQHRWAAFNKLSNILRSNLPINLKRKLFNQCVLSAMTYTSETWTLSKKIENKLRTAQRAMERAMLNITRKDKIRNKNIRNDKGWQYYQQGKI